MKKRSQGFSLIELLIVVTIILIIAAIAIPKLMTVKQQANATAAVSNMRALNNALTAYASQYSAQGYPATVANLGGTTPPPSATNALLVDNSLLTNPKQGYNFTYTPTGTAPVGQYTVTANPASASVSNRYFFTDESGVIRYNDGSAASVSSNALGS